MYHASRNRLQPLALRERHFFVVSLLDAVTRHLLTSMFFVCRVSRRVLLTEHGDKALLFGENLQHDAALYRLTRSCARPPTQ